MKNPLFESDPSDTDERRRSRDGQTSPGGIGRGWTEAPESHLRRVRAGGLLTKLPFDAKGTPRVRFFRVAASDRELQWGDPADAASPTLGSRLLLHEVQSVARGHATRAFEAHAREDPKRAGPPAECFSLVAPAESCDLRGGDAASAGSPHWSSRSDAATRKNRTRGALFELDGSFVRSPPARTRRRWDSGASVLPRPMPPGEVWSSRDRRRSSVSLGSDSNRGFFVESPEPPARDIAPKLAWNRSPPPGEDSFIIAPTRSPQRPGTPTPLCARESPPPPGVDSAAVNCAEAEGTGEP